MFDIDKGLSFCILLFILAIYCIITIPEVTDGFYHPDYSLVEGRLETWEITDIFEGYDIHIRLAMLKASDYLFDNTKVLPFVASILLIVTTYFITTYISKNNLAGLFAVSILTSSSLFRMFDTTPTYDNLWVLLYFVALYFSYRLKVWSFVIFALTLFCKPLTVLFLPAIVYRFRKSKKILIISGIVLTVSSLFVPSIQFSQEGFTSGLFDWWFYLFTDTYMIIMVPVIMILYLVFSIKKIPYSFDMLIGLLLTSFTGALVEGFTVINNEPYRYIPLLVFFSISMGNLIGMSKFNILEKQKSKHG